MTNVATVENNKQISELSAFEIEIQEHEKALNFIPDVSDKDSRDKSKKLVREARKTWNTIDAVRLEKKKEAEQVANAIHEQGKAALSRLESAYSPHKEAIDKWKAEEDAKEQKRQQEYNEACQWLRDVAVECLTSSVDEIKDFLDQVTSKDMENTGLNLSDNEKFEYGKIQMDAVPKIERALADRIQRDAEEERQRQAAIELAQEQEKLRQEREELERKQQEEREKEAARLAKEKAEQEAKEALERAEREAKEAKERAEVEAKHAAERAEREKQEAIEAERLRIEQEQARKEQEKKAAQEAEEKEAARKASNKAHRKSINNEALKCLVDAEFSEDDGKRIIELIAQGRISHITINY